MGLTDEMKRALKQSGYSGPAPAYCSIEDWCIISGMGRRWVYNAIADGTLVAVKCGARTLIDVHHGMALMRSLPPAKIRRQVRRAS
jgi:hypothetical protein